jgi:hypothetical protein
MGERVDTGFFNGNTAEAGFAPVLARLQSKNKRILGAYICAFCPH